MYKFFKKLSKPKGLTQIELMVALGISAILLSIITINLSGSQRKSSLSSEVNKFVVDFKEQQIKSMVGDGEGTGAANDYGIYIESTKYTLFRGSTYSSSSPSNFVINLSSTFQFTNPNYQIVFKKGSGEISSSTSATLRTTTTNEQKTININKYGVVTAIN